jgi:hypothetical protein
MSRDEVKSLNDLAMAHGGQLTINPQTGLPEAGFLSAILPMVAGAALGPAGFGLTSALGAGLAVGAGSMLLNPKQGLMGGLMAGLGAYGGAGLGESLAATGMQEAAKQKMVEQTMQEATKNAALEGVSLPSNYANLVQQQTFSPALQGEALSNALKGQSFTQNLGSMGEGVKSAFTPGGFSNLTQNMGGASGMLKTGLAAAAPLATQPTVTPPAAATGDKDTGQRYKYNPGLAQPLPAPDVPTYEDMMNKQGNFGRQQTYFPNQGYTKISQDEAKNTYGFAAGGPVEQMSNNAAIGANTMYPMANMATSAFAVPYQDPRSTNMMATMNPSGGGTVDAMSGEPNMQGTRLATGGVSDAGYNLGGYSDGGRLLRGPGDGVSDSIPASIGHKQPARLADGEFVVPARIVSELGNGSTEAGARKLYAMLDRVQSARSKSMGKGKVAKNTRADKYLPA